jgi:hypothetical protein
MTELDPAARRIRFLSWVYAFTAVHLLLVTEFAFLQGRLP